MRIKRLEIHGFKSFGDRVGLTFGDGITGVVGPNGCGKSNIVDAIRWCMGEMSAKHLRGRAMQDVIFAGSDSRGPMGMAEVTLTFHNDGNVPPQYSEFTEISVTRRLHRDGTSEYLINKVAARLRDITDLFLGTGVGTRAYSIIEQGRIGFIVSSRPEDRRSLIEEVAGITKFKARKKVAEKRMESSEQNLARVNDIIGEIERQLGSLRRQAKKAERYKQLRDELRDLELHAASVDILRFAALEKLHEGERLKLEQRLEDGQAALAGQESGLDAERLQLLELEQALQHKQQQSAEIDKRLAALERDLSHWRQQREDLRQRLVVATADVDEATARIRDNDAELGRVQAEIAALAGEADSSDGVLAAAQADVTELQRAVDALDVELDRMRREAVEHVHTAAQQRTRVEALERSGMELRQRRENAVKEKETVEQRLLAARERLADLHGKRDAAASELDVWTQRRAQAQGELAAATERLAAQDAEVARLKDELAERRSRLTSLREIAKRLDDYSDGVRALLGAEAGAAQPVAGIRALVSELIEVEPRYERAIEAAVGERLQYLVVDDHATAAQAIDLLRTRQAGRSGFVLTHPKTDVSSEVVAGEGVVGQALGFARVRDGYADLGRQLLGDVTLVETLPHALRLWRAGAHGRLVTLGGDVLDAAGSVVGGSNDGAGLLAKRREMRELDAQVAELTERMDAANAVQRQIAHARLQLDVDIQQLGKDIHAAELELVQLCKDIEASDDEAVRLDDRMEVVRYELQRCEENLAAISGEREAAARAADGAEAGKREVDARVDALLERKRGEVQRLDARMHELTSYKVLLAQRNEKLAAAREHLQRLQRRGVELAERVQRDRATIEESAAQGTELGRRVAEGEAEAKAIAAHAQTLHAELREARGQYETRRGSMAEVEQVLKTRRHDNTLVQDALMQLKMDLQRLDMDRQKLIEQTYDRHDVQLMKIVGDYHLRPAPTEEELKRRVELDKALKAMGPINLTAIDECQELERRHLFLTKQRDDLVLALDTLRKAIQRINRASRERFKQAFDAVNEMFKKVYPRLFRGGVAYLQLDENQDLLETGVEIIAQPPGKKLQNVGLLSGGEKALTATALIFAIFLIKPTPFCVLDEVDAPLDDANVGRFNQMLREISKISQFIVITHNKQTMSEADRLYGITMEEPGLSKLVAVDLDNQSSSEHDEAA